MILKGEELDDLRELLKNTPYELLSDKEILERIKEILEYLKKEGILNVKDETPQEENLDRYYLKIPKKIHLLDEEESHHKTR